MRAAPLRHGLGITVTYSFSTAKSRQLPGTPLSSRSPRSGDEILDGAGHHDFSSVCRGADPSGYMNGDASQVIAAHLTFARMKTSPDINTKPPRGVGEEFDRPVADARTMPAVIGLPPPDTPRSSVELVYQRHRVAPSARH